MGVDFECSWLAYRRVRITYIREIYAEKGVAVNEVWVFAYVVMPIVVVAFGYGMMKLSQWQDRMH